MLRMKLERGSVLLVEGRYDNEYADVKFDQKYDSNSAINFRGF